MCDPECQNGGLCVAPDICDCTSTGYSGDTCDLRKSSEFTVQFSQLCVPWSVKTAEFVSPQILAIVLILDMKDPTVLHVSGHF